MGAQALTMISIESRTCFAYGKPSHTVTLLGNKRLYQTYEAMISTRPVIAWIDHHVRTILTLCCVCRKPDDDDGCSLALLSVCRVTVLCRTEEQVISPIISGSNGRRCILLTAVVSEELESWCVRLALSRLSGVRPRTLSL